MVTHDEKLMIVIKNIKLFNLLYTDLHTFTHQNSNREIHKESIKVTSTTLPTMDANPKFINTKILNKLIAKPSGNMVRFKCPATGNPEPTIEWSKNGKKIERKRGQVLIVEWSITMEDLIPEDSGDYTCNICNIHGCIDFTSKLIVEGKYFTIHKFEQELSKQIFVYFRSHAAQTNHNRRIPEKLDSARKFNSAIRVSNSVRSKCRH